jgi:hypothetical protein
MKWKNARNDGPPRDKEQVLISVEGVYYIAVYDAQDRSFKVYDHLESFRFHIDKQAIYWTVFTDPVGSVD